MLSIHGTIRIGEAATTAKSTAYRQRGGAWPFWLAMAVLWIAGAAAGGAIGLVLHTDPFLTGGAGALIGVLLYARFAQWLSIWRFRRTQTGKGVSLDLPLRIEITPDAFVYEIGDTVTRAKWTAVSEGYLKSGYWIFMVQANPWFIPDRLFEDTGHCRRFLHQVLSHMSKEARDRSPDLVRFVEDI